MNSTSYKKVCEAEGLKFISTTKSKVDLKENEYYALMVTDYSGKDNPHVIGVDYITHEYLVGIERPNKTMGCYISKDFYKRKAAHRGTTIIVEVDDVTKFTVLYE